MSSYGPEHRSFERISCEDLDQLLTVAKADVDGFFRRHEDWAQLYRVDCSDLLCARGAANHYIGRGDGVHDFDGYASLAQNPARKWGCYRRRGECDFGHAKFGRSPPELQRPPCRRAHARSRLRGRY